VERYSAECNFSIQTSISGTVTYSVQFTNDEVFAANYDPAAGNWFNYASASGATATTFISSFVPVTAVRLNVASMSGTNAFATLILNQSSMPG
jgi:hypothetical protein